MDLQEKMKQEAISLGLCEQWQSEWGTPDADALCKKFIRGIDFCIEHNFPTAEFIKDNFDEKVLSENGIFVSGTHFTTGKRHYVVMGDADVTIEVQPYDVCDAFVRGNGKVKVIQHLNSHLYISAYDNCQVDIASKDAGCRLCMSYFGGIVNNVKLFDKFVKK